MRMRLLSLLFLIGPALWAADKAPSVIRQTSIYDYPQGFEEIYERPVVSKPPREILNFVEKDQPKAESASESPDSEKI